MSKSAGSDFPKNAFEFAARFANDEDACWDYLEELRWPDGFVCPRCGAGERNFIESRNLFVCENGHQTSLTAGTAMHRSHLDLRHWFFAAYLQVTQTPGISSVVLARQIGVKQETAFQLLHKLRAAMVNPARGQLNGTMEIDETFINAGRLKEVRAGRGSKQVVVVGAVEVRGTKSGRIRLRAIADASEVSLMDFIAEEIEEGSRIYTDGWKAYQHLPEYGYKHWIVEGEDSKEVAENMPHIHRVFSNLKAWLIGTHHGVSSKHMQAYLNEFVFRYNRRANPMQSFMTLLGITSEVDAPEYEELYSVGDEGGWVHPNPPEDEMVSFDLGDESE